MTQTEDRERENAYQRAYYQRHRDRVRERGRAYYAAHREEKRAYRERHRAQIAAYNLRYMTELPQRLDRAEANADPIAVERLVDLFRRGGRVGKGEAHPDDRLAAAAVLARAGYGPGSISRLGIPGNRARRLVEICGARLRVGAAS